MDGTRPGGIPVQWQYKNLLLQHDLDRKTIWYHMYPSPRPCFTVDLLNDIRDFQNSIKNWYHGSLDRSFSPIRYLVATSRVPGIFNLGGDLVLFRKLISDRNRDGLFSYAKACINVLHTNSADLDLPVTTISLVQGEALGGGFEAAISSTVVIAERRSQMGLPEILFNLFPGMGAYNLLARRIGAVRAEKIILSGRIYSAEELYELGVVDVLAEDGEGIEAVHHYIRKQDRFNNGYQAVHRVRRVYHPISHEELMHIATLWVDAALQLRDKDLRVMERLARSQEKLMVLKPPMDIKQLA